MGLWVRDFARGKNYDQKEGKGREGECRGGEERGEGVREGECKGGEERGGKGRGLKRLNGISQRRSKHKVQKMKPS